LVRGGVIDRRRDRGWYWRGEGLRKLGGEVGIDKSVDVSVRISGGVPAFNHVSRIVTQRTDEETSIDCKHTTGVQQLEGVSLLPPCIHSLGLSNESRAPFVGIVVVILR
jgi:hypothetical protein